MTHGLAREGKRRESLEFNSSAQMITVCSERVPRLPPETHAFLERLDGSPLDETRCDAAAAVGAVL